MAYRVRGEESKGVMRGRGAKWEVYITFERRDWLTVSPMMNLRIGHIGWRVIEIELTVLARQLADYSVWLDIFVVQP